MTSNAAPRTIQSLLRRATRTCECAKPSTSQATSIRQFSSSTSKQEEQYATNEAQKPRWSQTPTRMKAPFSIKLKDTTKPWTCNENPEVLDRFYTRFLGRGGDAVLTEEVKWLAITHKSFDQGRRGFNDRLAFLGRRIIQLQANLALLHSPMSSQPQSIDQSGEERTPFTHPALDGLANLSAPISDILTKEKFAKLAKQSGMDEIIRWTPRLQQNLQSSGLDAVLTTTVYAIIGAVALQRGGEVAAQVARDRVLQPLGLSL